VGGDAADAVRARLAWRCRRGTKELDLLLQRWLAWVYPVADAGSRALFESLLELPDPELSDYLLGGARPEREDLAALVELIRALPPRAPR
jgi:antitoxin CptB